MNVGDKANEYLAHTKNRQNSTGNPVMRQCTVNIEETNFLYFVYRGCGPLFVRLPRFTMHDKHGTDV